MRRLFLLGAAAAMLIASAAHADDSMKFELMPSGIIWAHGGITPGTDQKLASFSANVNLRGRTVVLDSGGGDVITSIKIGRALRKNHVTTMIGSVDQSGDIVGPGKCESMCPFIFMGGIHRYVFDGSRVTVHQIWISSMSNTKNDVFTTDEVSSIQKSIGEMAVYTVQMGVDPRFLREALTREAWLPLRRVTKDEMKKYHLTTK